MLNEPPRSCQQHKHRKHKSASTACHVLSAHHTLIPQEGYPHSPLSQGRGGSPSTQASTHPPPRAFCYLDTSSEGSWCAACQRLYEDTSRNGRAKRSGVNPSPPAPLSRHFDVMAALCFVMRRSCQISGPRHGPVCSPCWA